ncbi:MAG: hypothetical protein NVS1B7_1750 [Candidatus Saccharimonadales bacterium]
MYHQKYLKKIFAAACILILIAAALPILILQRTYAETCGDGVTVIPQGTQGDLIDTFCKNRNTPPTSSSNPATGGATAGSTPPASSEQFKTNDYTGPHVCGNPKDKQVHISINLGCVGEKCLQNSSPPVCTTEINPIVDAMYAILRFLSAGVGLLIVISVIIAGIQFTTSKGDPGATAKAIERVRSTVFALLLYIFAFALLNFLVPGGLFI